MTGSVDREPEARQLKPDSPAAPGHGQGVATAVDAATHERIGAAALARRVLKEERSL
jgi:hypothetical protein